MQFKHYVLVAIGFVFVIAVGFWGAHRLALDSARAAVAAPGPVYSADPAPADPAPADPTPAVPAPPPLVPYQGPVEHIFFHPLIAYPELAFDGDGLSRGYNDWFVTVKEFRRILDALYQNGYILVDIRSLYTETVEAGKPVLLRQDLMLPPDKKPLVLSIDDLNYYTYMRKNGNVHKLILDAEGRIATQSVRPKGETVVAYDNEIVPILDTFVAEHPDFSLGGAKGLIALTGYEGILGYRTNDTAAVTYETERKLVLQVVQRLKETGWSFASHGWGHLDAAKISYNGFVADTQRWKREVEPLVGPTPVYVYPFGSRVPPDDPKFRVLLEAGFRVICGIGPSPYLKVTPGYVLMDRRHIDGIALHTQRSLLLKLFDADQVIDSIRPGQY